MVACNDDGEVPHDLADFAIDTEVIHHIFDGETNSLTDKMSIKVRFSERLGASLITQS